jgi:hypothetical protein
MCKRNGEFVDHLLHCDVASTIWLLLLFFFFFFPSLFKVSWVMPRCVVDLYVCWWSSSRPRSAMVWKIVPTCLF